MPGGLTIQGIPLLNGGVITATAQIQSLLQSMGPAMAGLQPAFLVIDAIVKIMAVFDAIPGLITGNVVGFYNALADATKAVLALAQLQPALSLPLMLSDLIGALTTALVALKEEVVALQAMSAQGDALIAQAQAAGDAVLEGVGQCLKTQADAYNAHMIASLGPIGQLIDMATQLAGLMPSPPALPTVGDATGLDLDGLADFLDNLIAAFRAISIPGA